MYYSDSVGADNVIFCVTENEFQMKISKKEVVYSLTIFLSFTCI